MMIKQVVMIKNILPTDFIIMKYVELIFKDMLIYPNL